MGQRLVVNIRDDDGAILANAYYHWSAYTMCALEVVKQAIESDACVDYLSKIDKGIKVSKETAVKTAINMLVSTGGSLTEESRKYLPTINIKNEELREEAFDDCDRNNGLIGVGENETQNLLSWSEGTVDIFINEKNFDFCELLYCQTVKYETDDDIGNLIYFIESMLGVSCTPKMVPKLLEEALDNISDNKIPYYDISSILFRQVNDFMTDLSTVGVFFMEGDEDTVYTLIE